MNAQISAAESPKNPTTVWQWKHSFASLGSEFFTRLQPSALAMPHWVAASASAARELGLDEAWMASLEACEAFAGNAPLPGSESLASVYSGHQFGVWAGQLGDGRAILLGGLNREMSWPGVGVTDEVELQIKGAGRTPYSRGGDGMAVLRSSIREFLCSEAMHALGIPTTRALALVGSPQRVRRETLETAAVLTRVSPSFIRFGHFEHFAANQQFDALKKLADYVIGRFYPACCDAKNPYAALLEAVSERTAKLIAQWQAVGFCHGVMNTDNMSILGVTIDYGPFGFMGGFDPNHICNHSDERGRYAYSKQPNVAYWNLFCLGQALFPLIDDQDAALAALEPYKTIYPKAMLDALCAKMGLAPPPAAQAEATQGVVNALLKLLASESVDWTIFWSRWASACFDDNFTPVRDLFIDQEAFQHWMLSFLELESAANRRHDADIAQKNNPKLVLRNHLAQETIHAAETGNFEPLHTLFAALQRPFESAQPPAYTDFPPDWAKTLEVSCSS